MIGKTVASLARSDKKLFNQQPNTSYMLHKHNYYDHEPAQPQICWKHVLNT